MNGDHLARAGHVIAVLASKHFDIGDPAIDLRPSSSGKAFAGAKKLFPSARVIDAETRELVAIALSGRIGEEWLRRISQDEGPMIHPDPTRASYDLAFADQVVDAHDLDRESENNSGAKPTMRSPTIPTRSDSDEGLPELLRNVEDCNFGPSVSLTKDSLS